MDVATRPDPAAVALLEGWPLFDSAIVRHGFTPYMRDDELEAVTLAAVPGQARSYREGRYRFVFTHGVAAHVVSAVRDDVWAASWDDVFTDCSAWERAGCADGYVWGVNDMAAYPGARYLPDSSRAAEWSARLARPMHEVRIETNAHNIELVFRGLDVRRVARGDPATGALVTVEPTSIVPPAI